MKEINYLVTEKRKNVLTCTQIKKTIQILLIRLLSTTELYRHCLRDVTFECNDERLHHLFHADIKTSVRPCSANLCLVVWLWTLVSRTLIYQSSLDLDSGSDFALVFSGKSPKSSRKAVFLQ